MAKRNIVWISVIIMILVIGFIWLSQTIQWRSYIDAVEHQDFPVIERTESINVDTSNLSITALIPPSDTLNSIVNDIALQQGINATIHYLNLEELDYETYVNYLLTEDMGDIQLIPNEWILPLAVQGYFVPLDRLLTSEYLEEQIPTLLESMKWNSNVWGAPYQLDPYLVVPHLTLQQELIEANSVTEVVGPEQDVIEVPVEGVDVSAELSEQVVEDEQPDILVEAQPSGHSETIRSILEHLETDVPLINSDISDVTRLSQFLHFFDGQGVNSGYELSEEQISLLTEIKNNPNLVTEIPLDELIKQENGLPLYLTVKWSELIKYSDYIEKNYQLEQAMPAVYWMNGYSFVIRNHSNEHQAAGQWIEIMNRKMSDQHNQNIGMPIHKGNLNKLFTKWQQEVAASYMSTPHTNMFMNVSTNWADNQEQLNNMWKNDDSIENKLAQWLQQMNLVIDGVVTQ